MHAAARARVALVEPMGAHQVVWLDAAGVSLSVNLEATAAPVEGSEVGIAVDKNGLSLFDGASQQRL